MMLYALKKIHHYTTGVASWMSEAKCPQINGNMPDAPRWIHFMTRVNDIDKRGKTLTSNLQGEEF